MPDEPSLAISVESLYGLFGEKSCPSYELVAAEAVPPPYDRLLVHHDHMTVTMEAYYGGPVALKVLARHRCEAWYGRKILLLRDDRVVQFGIMRIRLDLCRAEVRAAVLREDTPLGTILIEHNVMRSLEPVAYFRMVPDAALSRWFGLASPRPTYGRLAVIHCNHQPAVHLLEVPAPIVAERG